MITARRAGSPPGSFFFVRNSRIKPKNSHSQEMRVSAHILPRANSLILAAGRPGQSSPPSIRSAAFSPGRRDQARPGEQVIEIGLSGDHPAHTRRRDRPGLAFFLSKAATKTKFIRPGLAPLLSDVTPIFSDGIADHFLKCAKKNLPSKTARFTAFGYILLYYFPVPRKTPVFFSTIFSPTLLYIPNNPLPLYIRNDYVIKT